MNSGSTNIARHLRELLFVCWTLLLVELGQATAQTQPPAPNETFDIIIGAMCIGDLPESARKVTGKIQQGSDFFRKWTLEWQTPLPPVGSPGSSGSSNNKIKAPASTAHPIIRFFRQAPQGDPGSSYKDLKGDVLLSGDIDRIRLNAVSSVYEKDKPALLRIDPEGMSVTVSHVQSGLARLFGGSIDLSGSKAWIEHSVKLLNVEGQPPQGSIEITSWARRLKGAKFVVQEGVAPKSLDMSSLRENITIRVPLTGATTELLNGDFPEVPLK